MLSFNNGDPPGPARHWIVGGGLARAVEKWVLTDVANEIKGNPELVGRRDVDARQVLIYRFPPFPAGGPNRGHRGAFVRVGRDEMVFVSLHGKRYVEAAVEMVLDLAKEAESPRVKISPCLRWRPAAPVPLIGRVLCPSVQSMPEISANRLSCDRLVELSSVQLLVAAAGRQQLCMCAALDDHRIVDRRGVDDRIATVPVGPQSGS
jgi:hypothetical protein